MTKVGLWVEAVCGVCAAAAPGRFVYGKLPRKRITDAAKREGFIFKNDETFCSKQCLKEFEDEQQSKAGDSQSD